MRTLLLFLFCLLVFVPIVKSQDDPEGKKIIRLVAAIPEVVDERRFFSGIHEKLVIMIDKIPTKEDNNYQVEVDEDQGWRLDNRFYFFVNAKTHAIRYWAVIEDKGIPLEVWRKRHYKDY